MRMVWMISIGLLVAGPTLAQHTITLNLQGMAPHAGQLFKARMVESPSGKQVAETTVVAVSGATLRLVFAGESGKSYVLDYFADMNGDGKYSPPPADHAWRKSAGPLHHQGIVIDAAHDLNFTDIQYPSAPNPVRRLDPNIRFRTGPRVNLLGRESQTGFATFTILTPDL